MCRPCDTSWCQPEKCNDVDCREDIIPGIILTEKDEENYYSQFKEKE